MRGGGIAVFMWRGLIQEEKDGRVRELLNSQFLGHFWLIQILSLNSFQWKKKLLQVQGDLGGWSANFRGEV